MKGNMTNEPTDNDCSNLDSVAQGLLDGLPAAPKINLAEVNLMNLIREENVFFYPACHFDWLPMLQYTHCCKLFIYCDWWVNHPSFDNVVRHGKIDIGPHQGEHTLRVFDIRNINGADMFDVNAANPFRHVPAEVEQRLRGGFDAHENMARQQVPVRWGRLMSARHSYNGAHHHIIIAYLSLEGVAAYQGFFANQRRSPKVLCINNCGDGFGGNYTAFHRRNEPLECEVRHAVENGVLAPETVLCDRDFDWPGYGPDGAGHYRHE